MKKTTWNQRLVYAMRTRGVSQSELAREIGVSPPTVHAWMHDQESLKATNKSKIDAVLRLPPGYLLDGTEDIDGTPLKRSRTADPRTDIFNELTADEAEQLIRSFSQQLSPSRRLRLARFLIDGIPESLLQD